MKPSARAAAVCAIVLCGPFRAMADEAETVKSSIDVFQEVMASPGKRLPARLLRDAKGVAIVPGVIKVGFVAGVRRGRGVLVVRDAEGNWSLPQFLTLTGGSVGWQVGAQSSDVVLVFKTQRSVDNLLEGKFTIGADAAAAAGPVGRRIEAATDGQLKAEIYSYSRSRGLFAGVSLDGAALEIDSAAYTFYYGRPGENEAGRVPEEALRLVEMLAAAVEEGGMEGAQRSGEEVGSGPALLPEPADLRTELARSSAALSALLDERWTKFLALPPEIAEGKDASVQELAALLRRYDRVAGDPQYRALTEKPEFRATHGLLKEYDDAVAASAGKVRLPPPPEEGPVLRPGR